MSVTLEDFAKLWATAAPSFDTSRRREDAVAPLLKAFAGATLDGITEAEARAWAAEHPGSLRYAKSMFKMAADDGVIAKSPFARLMVVKRKRPVTVPAKEKLLAAIELALELPYYGREFHDLLLIAAGTGLRVSELCKLEVQDLSREPDLRVRVRDGKGGVHRDGVLALEPFGGELVADAVGDRWMAALARGPEQAFGQVGDEIRLWLRPATAGRFVGSREAPWLDRGQVGRLWAAVRGRVGLDRCRFHDIRHFHATWLLDCGCSAEDVAFQLHGHHDPRTVIEVYGHPSHELTRLRLRRLTRENGCHAV